MSQQVVELDDEGKEVVAGKIRLLSQRFQVFLERVGAAFNGGKTQGSRLALDRMRLPKQRIELLALIIFIAAFESLRNEASCTGSMCRMPRSVST
jgi:hypothetical protein